MCIYIYIYTADKVRQRETLQPDTHEPVGK